MDTLTEAEIDNALSAIPELLTGARATPPPMEDIEFIDGPGSSTTAANSTMGGDGAVPRLLADESADDLGGYLPLHIAPRRAGWTILSQRTLRIIRCCSDRQEAINTARVEVAANQPKIIYVHDGFGSCRRIVEPRCVDSDERVRN